MIIWSDMTNSIGHVTNDTGHMTNGTGHMTNQTRPYRPIVLTESGSYEHM